jgi:hypothetical protein
VHQSGPYVHQSHKATRRVDPRLVPMCISQPILIDPIGPYVHTFLDLPEVVLLSALHLRPLQPLWPSEQTSGGQLESDSGRLESDSTSGVHAVAATTRVMKADRRCAADVTRVTCRDSGAGGHYAHPLQAPVTGPPDGVPPEEG